jgi:hypothetical protein
LYYINPQTGQFVPYAMQRVAQQLNVSIFSVRKIFEEYYSITVGNNIIWPDLKSNKLRKVGRKSKLNETTESLINNACKRVKYCAPLRDLAAELRDTDGFCVGTTTLHHFEAQVGLQISHDLH